MVTQNYKTTTSLILRTPWLYMDVCKFIPLTIYQHTLIHCGKLPRWVISGQFRSLVLMRNELQQKRMPPKTIALKMLILAFEIPASLKIEFDLHQKSSLKKKLIDNLVGSFVSKYFIHYILLLALTLSFSEPLHLKERLL